MRKIQLRTTYLFEYNLLPADFMQNEFQAFFEVGVKLDLVVTMQRQRQSSVNKINSYIRYHLCMITVVISSRSTDNIVCTHLKQNEFRFYIYQAILKRVFTLSERILNKVTFYVSSST